MLKEKERRFQDEQNIEDEKIKTYSKKRIFLYYLLNLYRELIGLPFATNFNIVDASDFTHFLFSSFALNP